MRIRKPGPWDGTQFAGAGNAHPLSNLPQTPWHENVHTAKVYILKKNKIGFISHWLSLKKKKTRHLNWKQIALFSSWTKSVIPFSQVLGSTNRHPRGLGIQGNNNVLNKLPSDLGEEGSERLIIRFPVEVLRWEPSAGRRHIRRKKRQSSHITKKWHKTQVVYLT